MFRLPDAEAERYLPIVKTLTRQQIQSRKAKAVRFVRDVLGDTDRADEIEEESLEDYASRRKIHLINPEGGKAMSRIKIWNPKAVSQPNRAGSVLRNAGATVLRNAAPAVAQKESPALAALRQQNEELQRQNDDLQDQLDRIADLAGCDDPNCQPDENELVDTLNDILDIAAAGNIEEDDEDDEDDPRGE
jgi:hypothetical protein